MFYMSLNKLALLILKWQYNFLAFIVSFVRVTDSVSQHSKRCNMALRKHVRVLCRYSQRL